MKTIAALLILSLSLSCSGTKNINQKSQPESLAGTYVLSSMNGKSMEGNSMTLVFNADGSLAGSSSCNKLFGTFSQNGTELSFSGIGATKMYCNGRMELEKEYFKGLEVTTQFAIVDGNLELKNEDSVLMTFKPEN